MCRAVVTAAPNLRDSSGTGPINRHFEQENDRRITPLSSGGYDQAFQLQTLGDVRLSGKAGETVRLRSRKSVLLLAVLAVDPGHGWTREQLAEIFWADHGDEQARSSLRTALSDIRRHLREDAIVIAGNAVKLGAGRVVTDVGRLRALAASDHQWQLDDFNSLYAGEFLSAFDACDDAMVWVRGLRTECADLAEGVLRAETASAIAGGLLEPAILWVRRLLSLDPFKEESHRILMRLYADCGERSKAISQFQNCRNLLCQELGIEPSPESSKLADEIALGKSATSPDLHQFGTHVSA